MVDCLTVGEGKRIYTRDFIGAGPRYVAGFIENISKGEVKTTLIRGKTIISEKIEMLKRFPIICISSMTMDLRITQRIFNKWSESIILILQIGCQLLEVLLRLIIICYID